MSNAELPKSVDPYRLAEQNTVLEGFVPLSAMARFNECISGFEEGGVCQVTLSFSMDGERRRIVVGKLSANVELQCQRCMGPKAATLVSEFRLGLVTSDAQAQQLPRDLEPYLTEGFNADLWAMVEDELLLVVPPFPLHERDQCPAREALEALEGTQVSARPEAEPRENPFSVLADLKSKKH